MASTEQKFLEEIEQYCYTTSILTITYTIRETARSHKIDMKRNEAGIEYGVDNNLDAMALCALLFKASKEGAGVMLRSFLEEKDPNNNFFPFKELRGYFIFREGDAMRWNKMEPRVLFECCNTNADTGEMMLPERSVRYC